jgi:hypothetical protein
MEKIRPSLSAELAMAITQNSTIELQGLNLIKLAALCNNDYQYFG